MKLVGVSEFWDIPRSAFTPPKYLFWLWISIKIGDGEKKCWHTSMGQTIWGNLPNMCYQFSIGHFEPFMLGAQEIVIGIRINRFLVARIYLLRGLDIRYLSPSNCSENRLPALVQWSIFGELSNLRKLAHKKNGNLWPQKLVVHFWCNLSTFAEVLTFSILSAAWNWLGRLKSPTLQGRPCNFSSASVFGFLGGDVDSSLGDMLIDIYHTMYTLYAICTVHVHL